MPRVFTRASSERVHSGTTAPGGITGPPFSAFLWYFPTDLAGSVQVFWYLGNSSSNTDDDFILFTDSSDRLIFRVTKTTADTITGSILVQDTWNAIGITAATASDRTLWLNGVSNGTSSNSKIPTGIDRWAIGQRMDSAPDLPASARIFWTPMWNVDIGAHNHLLLAKGADPRSIRRDALKWFPRFDGDEDVDRISHTALTAENTPTVHPSLPPNVRLFDARGRARQRHYAA